MQLLDQRGSGVGAAVIEDHRVFPRLRVLGETGEIGATGGCFKQINAAEGDRYNLGGRRGRLPSDNVHISQNLSGQRSSKLKPGRPLDKKSRFRSTAPGAKEERVVR